MSRWSPNLRRCSRPCTTRVCSGIRPDNVSQRPGRQLVGVWPEGFKGVGKWLDRDYLLQKDPPGTGAWARSGLSNAFTFDENVQALYAVLSQGVAKLDFQAGVRGEYASRNCGLAEPKSE